MISPAAEPMQNSAREHTGPTGLMTIVMLSCLVGFAVTPLCELHVLRVRRSEHGGCSNRARRQVHYPSVAPAATRDPLTMILKARCTGMASSYRR